MSEEVLPVLAVRDATLRYGAHEVLTKLQLDVQVGEIVGVVGASGSGKSTLLRAIAGLERLTSGEILFEGKSLPALKQRARVAQLVFQDPTAALDPLLTVFEAVEEPLVIHGVSTVERRRLVEHALEEVGLASALSHRQPAQLSVGERQRVTIARALVLSPKLLLLDEPTSSLDMRVQAQVINMLMALRTSRRLAMLVVTHDLKLVAHMADRIDVLSGGAIVERGPVTNVFTSPTHAFTKSLLAAGAKS